MTHLWTIGLQVVNFLLLLGLLWRFLWKPVRASIDRRKQEIDDEGKEAKVRAAAVDASRAAYESEVEALDLSRARVLAAAAVALAGDREQVLAKARALADTELGVGREALAAERRTVAGEVTDATLDVARTIAEKLLGDMDRAAILDIFLDQICEGIERLPTAERASMCSDLQSTPEIRIATAPALDADATTRLRARLAGYFGAAVRLEFLVDAALIVGAELRLPHSRIGHSFQQGLAAAREKLAATPVEGGAPEKNAAREDTVSG
jgi:F-type H+-transporting ATPase subunit b